MGWFDLGEPHLARGPFTRWPRITDGVLASVVFAVSLVAVTASGLGDDEDFTFDSIGDRPTGSIILLGLAAMALLWRRHRAMTVTGFVMVIMAWWAFAGYGDGQELALVTAIYAVGRYSTNNRYSIAALTAVLTVSIIGTVIDANQRIDIAPAILLAVIPWYLGRRIRNRGDYLALLKERAERLDADQHARAREAVADERSRIARELHDIVAHQVSMMTVQAGAAKTIARHDIEAAIGAMGDVERSGRQALGELRHLLGVLRPDKPDNGDLGPQPGLADVSTLVEELRHTGAEVAVTIDTHRARLSATVELSAYRIVQESLTNILKHAGPNPTVNLSIGVDDEGLVITITNNTKTGNSIGSCTSSHSGPSSHNGTDPPKRLPTSGYGIVGMRERATLLGGTLTAGPQPPNGFVVDAHIPLDRERI